MERRPNGAKIRVIIKRPDELYGHVSAISPTLENFQRNVGGYIEVAAVLEVKGQKIAIVCNEEGKINGSLVNMKTPGDFLFGTIIVCGVDGEDFSDLPITFSFQDWKNIVALWRRQA